jgi:hypothetical protein
MEYWRQRCHGTSVDSVGRLVGKIRPRGCDRIALTYDEAEQWERFASTDDCIDLQWRQAGLRGLTHDEVCYKYDSGLRLDQGPCGGAKCQICLSSITRFLSRGWLTQPQLARRGLAS